MSEPCKAGADPGGSFRVWPSGRACSLTMIRSRRAVGAAGRRVTLQVRLSSGEDGNDCQAVVGDYGARVLRSSSFREMKAIPQSLNVG